MAIDVESGLRAEELGHRAALDAGLALLDAGDAAAAVGFLRRANDLRQTPIGLVRLGAAYRDLGMRASAIDSYEAAIRLEGRGEPDLHARVGLAAVLADPDDLDDPLSLGEDLLRAVDLLQTVLNIEPRNSRALWTFSRCCERIWRLTGEEEMRDRCALARLEAKACDPRTEHDRQHELRGRAARAQRLVIARPVAQARVDAAVAEPSADADSVTAEPVRKRRWATVIARLAALVSARGTR